MPNQILKIATIFLFLGFPVLAASPLDVLINEIAWMGSERSFRQEWIELYNNTDFAINLEGWLLKTADRTPEIYLTGTIPAKGFYLLERSDDNTVPHIPADQIYKGALKNNGENLKLYDNFGNLIDWVDCSRGWFAGDNQTKQTMERVGSDPTQWANSQNPGGTPKAKNSITTLKKKPKEKVEFSEIKFFEAKKELANISPSLPPLQLLFVLGIALIVAIFSGITILILKKRLKIS